MDAKVERGEFAETAMRHFCRNPKCRAKLKTPTSNSREAFCSLKPNGCRDRFYRLRCFICEDKKPGRLDALTCGRRKCKNAIRRLQTSEGIGVVEIGVGNSIKPGLPDADKDGRGWRQITGPALTSSQFHCATVGGSAMDEVRRIEAKNRALLKDHFTKLEAAEIAANGEFTDPDWREVVSPDGVKCFITKSAPIKRAITKTITAETTTTEMAIPDDLSIPGFLRRQS
jgi:hypothetical protein